MAVLLGLLAIGQQQTSFSLDAANKNLAVLGIAIGFSEA
jgi:hypothetical protein